jgi:membrane-associated phospholipid phosphatase
VDPRTSSSALLPGWARRPAAWLVAGCAVIVAVIGALVAGQTRADPFDRAIDTPIISALGSHANLMFHLTWPGTRTGGIVLTAIIGLGCLAVRRYGGVVLVVFSMVIAVGLDDYVLKPLVHRTYLGSLVFPSGHTAATVTLAAVLTLLLAPVVARPAGARQWLAGLVLVIAWLAVVVVVLAVIALRWHYFTDTVAGAAVGIGTVCAVALTVDRVRAAGLPGR